MKITSPSETAVNKNAPDRRNGEMSHNPLTNLLSPSEWMCNQLYSASDDDEEDNKINNSALEGKVEMLMELLRTGRERNEKEEGILKLKLRMIGDNNKMYKELYKLQVSKLEKQAESEQLFRKENMTIKRDVEDMRHENTKLRAKNEDLLNVIETCKNEMNDLKRSIATLQQIIQNNGIQEMHSAVGKSKLKTVTEVETSRMWQQKWTIRTQQNDDVSSAKLYK